MDDNETTETTVSYIVDEIENAMMSYIVHGSIKIHNPNLATMDILNDDHDIERICITSIKL